MNASSGLSVLNEEEQRIISVLIESIRGSSVSRDIDGILTNQIRLLNCSLFEDKNPLRFHILIENEFPVILTCLVDISVMKKNLTMQDEIMKLLINVTDESEDFCEAVCNTNLPELLIDIIIKYSTSDESNFKLILFSALNITFNILRFQKFRESFQRKRNLKTLKKVLVNLTDSNVDSVKFVSTLILGFLTKENEESVIRVILTSNVIECIIKYIKSARIKTNNDGFNVWELLLGLEALSEITSLRKTIFGTNNSVSTLLEIINMDSPNMKEVQVVLSILKKLAFDLDIKTVLKLDFKIEYDVKPYLKCDHILVQKIALEIFTTFTTAEFEEKLISYDVFICFSEADKDIMTEIEDYLSKFLKVYSQKLQGREHSQIGESKFVVVGLSNSFHDDISCKSALVHAYNKNKHIIPLCLIHKLKPYGWMKNFLEVDNFIDFSDHSLIKDSFLYLRQFFQKHYITFGFSSLEISKSQRNESVLINEHSLIGTESGININNVKKEVISENFVLCEEQMTDLSIETLSERNNSNFVEWTENEVIDWLNDNRLSSVNNKLNEFNGEMLKTIIDLRKNVPKTYYRNLESSLQFTFVEILKFDCALNKLNR